MSGLDWNFVLESLRWSKYDYEQKAQKYLSPAFPTYREYRHGVFEPKIKQFDDTIQAITQIKEILTGSMKTHKEA